MIFNELTEDEKREELIKVAKSCLDTPYHHRGRKKGVGLDCIGLVVYVMKECGLNTDFDNFHYERVPDGFTVMKTCAENATQITFEEIKNGDFIVFRSTTNNPQHLAFYFIENGIEYMIHATAEKGANRVVINNLDRGWKKQIAGVYKLKF